MDEWGGEKNRNIQMCELKGIKWVPIGPCDSEAGHVPEQLCMCVHEHEAVTSENTCV